MLDDSLLPLCVLDWGGVFPQFMIERLEGYGDDVLHFPSLHKLLEQTGAAWERGF